MSVRVVARIRPLLKAETEKDVIVHAARGANAADTEKKDAETRTIVRIPNPKKDSESFSFQFNSVYGQEATQAQVFDNEVSPTVKHLFKGFDVTIFAYGVTGTGKTHTMRGGKALADRGVIPRLLSSIHRRARKAEKDSNGDMTVEVSMSYYEIYNDKVFDLFEPPEKRTPAGLPIRDNEKGKAVVVGLTERPCTSLKEFEQLYDQANINRSTSATKLNAHSSRSHAILCVKITQTTGDSVRASTVSAIDLAGSEDNRRTDNNKERLVESAAINKSLFVLAQCVEAISKAQTRVPYRESKMTRILALGQNRSHTVMVLNLAPVKSYHLDTLSSLNFANRTKKIEVNEIENQPYFREHPGKKPADSAITASSKGEPGLNRQPLRPKILSHNSHLKDVAAAVPRPTKQFAVFTDAKPTHPKPPPAPSANTSHPRTTKQTLRSPKRPSTEVIPTLSRPAKVARPNPSTASVTAPTPGMSQSAIEALIERKVTEALAEQHANTTTTTIPTGGDPISDEVQKRLDALEKRVEGQETERAEGLQYLLMAKQHQVRGEEGSALKMYELALPHFPGNERLMRKIVALRDKLQVRRSEKRDSPRKTSAAPNFPKGEVAKPAPQRQRKAVEDEDEDMSYHAPDDAPSDSESDAAPALPRTKLRRPQPAARARTAPLHPAAATPQKHSPHEESGDDSEDELAHSLARDLSAQTPRTKKLLEVINSRDVSQIKLLKGVGKVRAERIVDCLCDLDLGDDGGVGSLEELRGLKGLGGGMVEKMRVGMVG